MDGGNKHESLGNGRQAMPNIQRARDQAIVDNFELSIDGRGYRKRAHAKRITEISEKARKALQRSWNGPLLALGQGQEPIDHVPESNQAQREQEDRSGNFHNWTSGWTSGRRMLGLQAGLNRADQFLVGVTPWHFGAGLTAQILYLASTTC